MRHQRVHLKPQPKVEQLIPMQIGTITGFAFYASEADRQRAIELRDSLIGVQASQMPARPRQRADAPSPSPLPTTAPAAPPPPKDQE